MRRVLAALWISVFAGAVAQAGSPKETPSVGQRIAAEAVVNAQIFSAGDDPFPSHPVAFAGGVTGIPDLTYQILPRFRPGKLDLYLPPAAFKGPRPTVVFIHGGGWVGGGNRLSGAFDNFPKVLASIARQGYVVAAVSYRFSGEAPFPAAIQDVKAAIRWLRANAGKYRIDKDRFATFGGSAGGQLAALAATSCGVDALSPPGAQDRPRNATVENAKAGVADPARESDCVQGAVAWYGIFDFATMPGKETERAYLGCSATACTDAQTRAASAVSYLGASTPPILLIAGDSDKTVPPKQTLDFHSAMQARGLKSELLMFPDIDHSFIGRTPADTQAASKTALARTVDFFERVLREPVRR